MCRSFDLFCHLILFGFNCSVVVTYARHVGRLFNCVYNFAAMEDIAIMKQMHKHEAQVQSLREIFHEIDNQKSSVAA